MTLERIAEDLHVMPVQMRLMGVDLQRNVVFLVHADGSGISLISPVPQLTPALTHVLGEVQHIVAPSCFHDTGIKETQAAFPEATSWVVEGLFKTFPHMNPRHLSAASFPDAWGESIEIIPIQGIPNIQEHVIWHAPSKSLIVADLLFNIRLPLDPWSSLFYWLNGVYNTTGMSRIFRSATRDKAALASSIHQLARYHAKRIVVCHGDVIEGSANVQAALERTYNKLTA